MGLLWAMIAFSIVLVGFLVLAKLCIRNLSLPCQHCLNPRVTLFRKLPFDQQEVVLGYFRRYEHREPDTEGLFVCVECKTVYDDFSGEKISREIDWAQIRSICKVCNHIVINCGPDMKDIRCKACGTSYKWEVDAESGFRFLMPPPDTKVTKLVDYGYA